MKRLRASRLRGMINVVRTEYRRHATSAEAVRQCNYACARVHVCMCAFVRVYMCATKGCVVKFDTRSTLPVGKGWGCLCPIESGVNDWLWCWCWCWCGCWCWIWVGLGGVRCMLREAWRFVMCRMRSSSELHYVSQGASYWWWEHLSRHHGCIVICCFSRRRGTFRLITSVSNGLHAG
jgi:hypothetical protein